jgi:hypothetical protein
MEDRMRVSDGYLTSIPLLSEGKDKILAALATDVGNTGVQVKSV